MNTFKPERVVEVVWPWRAGVKSLEAGNSQDRHILARKSILQSSVMAVVSLLIWRFLDRGLLAATIFSLAVVTICCGLWAPTIFASIDRFGKLIGEMVATALTRLILTPFFCIVCLPAKLYLTLRRTDPLERAFPTNQASYWKPYKQNDSQEFKRQF